MLVYFAKNKNNLLVQLVGPTSNYISTFIIHSVIYYYFLFNILSQQFDDLYILVFYEDH
jgi:hypothetical protein